MIFKKLLKLIRKQSNGFTLLELLVVISIIGILVSLVSVSYSTAQKKSRDAKRKGDLKSIQNAFEQYYAVYNGYPATCPALTAATENFLLGGYPADPKGTDTYLQITPAPSCDATSYCFRVYLETGAGGNCGSSCSEAGSQYYCISNLQ